MREECMFKTLTEDELQVIDAGGLFLAILSGIATVAATIAVAYAAPPGTKKTGVKIGLRIFHP